MSNPAKRKVGSDGRAHGSKEDIDGAAAASDHSVCEGSKESVTPQPDSRNECEVLAEFDRQFRTMFEATADGIVVADSQTRRFYTANLAFSRMAGYTPEEVQRLALADIHPPETLPLVTEQFVKLLNRELAIARDVPVKRKDGSIFHADISSHPVTLAGKACLMGFFRDVSERKRMEDRLRETESRFQSIMEQSSEGIVLTDETGNVIEWNRAQEEVTGWPHTEVLGRPLWDVARELMPAGRSHEVVKQWATEVCRTGEIEPSQRLREQEFIRRDGARRYLQIVIHAVRTRKGFRIGSICRDVTERKAVERALLESEEKYRTLVESAGETIALVDRRGTFLFLNRTAAARLGGTPNDYVGKTMWDLFPGAIADRQVGSVRKVIDTGEGLNVIVPTEVQGQQRWYNTTIEPIRDAAGQITTALVVGRDIHELQQARQELDQYREKMSRAEQLASLGTLSATIAHELTQPLTVSRLSLEEAMAEMQAAGDSHKIMESLRECLEGISDATSRVMRFRNFTRQASQEAPHAVRLQDVITRTVRLLDGKAREQHISLSTRGVSTLPPVHANEKDIEQMCFALIENAIQAADGKKPRELVISGRKAHGGIMLLFEDTCGGIAPEHLNRLFEPFFTTKPPGEGTGLGLCIVDRIVTQAGGTVRVENHPGEGATFCVTLPLQPQA